MKRFLSAFVLLAFAFPTIGQEPALKYATGYKPAAPEVKAAQIRKTGWVKFPTATAPSWDCRQLGIVPPVVNQANCGSCWDFDGCGVVTMAHIKAGYAKPDGKFRISEQYVLDCGRNGGCNGDDHSSVFNMAKGDGLVLESEYGPYQAREGRCKDTAGMKRYKIADWGYCEGGANGPASTQSIKDAMVQYGPIGVAIAADNRFGNCKPDEVFQGNNHGINHEVILVGWNDDPKIASGGYWILRNSWGSDWCDGGYCKIAYKANGVGTDAAWVSVAPLPVPPGPTPPVPPVPGQAPAITSGNLGHAAVGASFSFQITATNAPTGWGAAGLPPGLAVNNTGLISGTPTLAGSFAVVVSATNASGTGVGNLTIVVTAGPGPTPPGSVTITLTPEQVKSVIDQSGGILVTPDMTLQQVIDAMGKRGDWKPMPKGEPIPPPQLEEKVDKVYKAVDAIMRYLLKEPSKN